MRLTKYHREQIETRLLRNRFEKRQQRIDRAEAKFGMSVYKAAFTRDERRTMLALPSGWMPTTRIISAAIKGTKDSFTVDEPVAIPVIYKDKWDNNVPLVIIDSTENTRLLERYEAIQEEKDQLTRQKYEAKREINAVLAGITTANQLKEHWPEIKGIVDDIVPAQGQISRALVIKTERVNDILGLDKLRPHLMEEVSS
jgi:hypothetical protein